MQPVLGSSNVKAVRYDEDSRVLTIKFHSGGIYEYLDVPLNVYKDFLLAGSKGSFVHERLKNKYPYRRL